MASLTFDEIKNIVQIGDDSLWDRVCMTDPRSAKKASNGEYSFTSIKAQWQFRSATKEWGSIGGKWYVKWEVDYRLSNEKELWIKVEVYYPDCIEPVSTLTSVGLAKTQVEKGKTLAAIDAGKKCITDGITKCLSELGFNADIFMDLFDTGAGFQGNKYQDDVSRNPNPRQPAAGYGKQNKDAADDEAAAIRVIRTEIKDMRDVLGITDEHLKEMIEKNNIKHPGAMLGLKAIKSLLKAEGKHSDSGAAK